jgi:hypothetical protein
MFDKHPVAATACLALLLIFVAFEMNMFFEHLFRFVRVPVALGATGATSWVIWWRQNRKTVERSDESICVQGFVTPYGIHISGMMA